MINIICGLLFAFLVYLTYLFVIIKNPRSLKKFIFEGRETNMLKGRFKLDYNKLDHKMVANYFAITNSCMIGLIFILVINIPNFVLKILVSFFTLLILTIVSYLKIGEILTKKEGKICTITKK